MTQNTTGGYGTYINYGYETTYGTAVSGTRDFGMGRKVTVTNRNNMERIYGLGNRNAQANVAKKFEGNASVEFLMSNGSFFRGVLGGNADGGGAGPTYTHTYTEANTVPSFTIATGTELGDNDEVTTLVSAKVSSMTMTASVNEVVRVRLECPYKDITLASSGIGSQVTASPYNDTPFSFAQGTLELPTGSTIGYVQSFELTVNNSLEGIWGLGSRLKASEVEKIREYNIKMTIAFTDTSVLLQKFYGQTAPIVVGDLADVNPATTATLVLTFTNGGSTSALRSIVITLANIYLDDHTLPKDVNEVIKEDVTGWALSGTSVVWTNATTGDTGSP
jgi:hypothetical protein